MRNLVKYVGIGLLVMGLAACDDKDTNATAQGSVAESNATGNPVNLLDGKLSFSLPADMTDQSGKLGTQANNMHVWSDATGQKAVIVIMGDDPKEDLAVLAKLNMTMETMRKFRRNPFSAGSATGSGMRITTFLQQCFIFTMC